MVLIHTDVFDFFSHAALIWLRLRRRFLSFVTSLLSDDWDFSLKILADQHACEGWWSRCLPIGGRWTFRSPLYWRSFDRSHLAPKQTQYWCVGWQITGLTFLGG